MPKIIITFGEGGPTQIEGPIDNKEMCYHAILDGVLALAAYEPRKIVPGVLVPFDPTKGGFTGGKGGVG